MHQTILPSIINLGTARLTAEHQCRIIVVNTLSLMTALMASTMGTFIFVFTGDVGVLVAAWLEAILFSVFILLNYLHWDGVARVSFMVIHNIAILYFGVCRGLIVEEELLTVFLVLVSLLIFAHLWQSLAWSLFSIILLFLGKANQRFGFYPTEPLKGTLFHDLGTVAILMMIFCVIYFYKKYWTLLNRQLDETNKGLEEEVLRQTAQLRKVNEDLETANENIRRFTQMFCHDVRDELFRHQGLSSAVINKIRGHSDSFETIVQSTDLEKLLSPSIDLDNLVATIETLHDIGNNVYGMIRNALDLRRIDAGTFGETELENIYLIEWCHELLRTPRYTAGKRGVAIDLLTKPGLPTCLKSSRILLERAVKNLLSNAVKFSPENGRVTLRLQTDGANLLIDVIDQGPGIKDEDIDRIFQLYVTDGEGVGLGLYIALNAVTHLNGEILVNPGGNKTGSIFRISLPMTSCEEYKPSMKIDMGASQLLQGAKILVVDDNHLNRMLLSLAVKKLGCVSFVAKSGGECLDLVSEIQPHLILLDAKMPGMSGLDTLKILRMNKNANVAGVPVLIVTADEFVESENEYRRLASDFLYKPYTANAMEAALLAALMMKDIPSSSS
ncbi:response regulator [Chitinophaga sp. G-6-1-13]|uniref:histidine kinase n=1 Tax=Chitinophaga fulva TaxID=2728842 RepID=A0A848GP56_9BACT|nr:hybrid sensor histidine kinase/response regulator [Chitinophaga fulva]NML40276.1 response regulator [Chitinophaga fulva]